MPLILKNIPNSHFNKMVLSKHYLDFFILNESSRRILANLFDSIGNIANYTDYNSFLKKFETFNDSPFQTCHCSSLLKRKLQPGEGLVIMIDENQVLDLPNLPIERWFLNNYSRIYNRPLNEFYEEIQIVISSEKEKEKEEPLISYPLSEDEMIQQEEYIANNSYKFTYIFENPEEYYKNYFIKSNEYLTESIYSDHSDDVHLFLKRKQLSEMKEEIEQVEESEKEEVEESEEEVEESENEVEESEKEEVEESEEKVEESEKEQEEVEEVKEERKENTIVKELFEKHGVKNDTNTAETNTTNSTYSSKLWSFLGWK